ncbi:MAG: hypothetical protein M3P30_02635 [Chloroflexota bacterium]|nr:hypothetical protein [Chloroflexota bacterium]
MPTTITTIRARVRQDLHDEDSSAYRWTDAVLDRHTGRAVNEYSLHAPLEQRTTLTATPGSRDISVASLTSVIDIEAVEWPVGEFPPRRVGWSEWQTTITLDVVNEPNAADNVYVFWTKMHTLDGSSSTLPVAHEDMIAAGAAAYAALDWTSYAANRINTGGDDVWGRYKAFGEERLRYFRSELTRIARRNSVRQRRLYTTDAPSVFEQNRVKY